MKKTNRITLDSRPVFRKRKIHFNTQVSSGCDEFSCEGEADVIRYSFEDMIDELNELLSSYGVKVKRPKAGPYGTSKLENLVSNHYTINGMRSSVGF